jgi:hypothetical protein
MFSKSLWLVSGIRLTLLGLSWEMWASLQIGWDYEMRKVLSNWYDRYKALVQPKWLSSSLLFDSVILKEILNNEFNTLMDKFYLEEIYKLEMEFKFYVVFSAKVDFYPSSRTLAE